MYNENPEVNLLPFGGGAEGVKRTTKGRIEGFNFRNEKCHDERTSTKDLFVVGCTRLKILNST
jgi:hypothetical protein